MSEMKHTPGPWRANASWIEGPAMALRIASVDWPSATPGSAPRNVAEARANARLIAAAPDLLEAAKAILARFPSDHGPSSPLYDEAKALSAAIAKAEGRS